jgi:hypothetical protein
MCPKCKDINSAATLWGVECKQNAATVYCMYSSAKESFPVGKRTVHA